MSYHGARLSRWIMSASRRAQMLSATKRILPVGSRAGEKTMHRWLAAVVCGLVLMMPQALHALGLGEITTRSALNEPMRAEIQLLGATRDELRSLEVRLAPVETFQRYGIDRPAFLSQIQFRVRADSAIIEVTSGQPITEPFVTLLVEVVWPRGRLLREYTMLLDPPTYVAPAEASAPAPTTRSSSQATRSSGGAVQRQTQSRPSTAPAPRRAAFNGSSYEVQRNDTLWEIANRIRPAGTDVNQMMVALYEANPSAFDGNINLLRAGAVLQVPTEDSLSSVTRSSALSEVRRQNQNWRGGTGSLTLVPPDEDARTGTVASGSGASSSSGSGSSADDAALRAELAEAERQLAIRNQELARLRAQLEAQQAAEAAAGENSGSDASAATEDSAAVGAVDDSTAPTETEAPLYGETTEDGAESEVFAETETTDAAGDSEGTAEEEAVAEEPAAERPRAATPAVVVPTEEPSLIEKLLGSIWTYVAAGAAIVLGILGIAVARRRGESDTTGTWEALDAADLEDLDGTLAATGRLRELDGNRGSGDTIRKPIDPKIDDTIEDSMERTSPVDEVAPPPPAAPTAPPEEFNIEDTFSSDTAINLDQSDPLAEADFHMAYGLFDQAADLVNGALAIDSSDVGLKQKLCEIYFQWGKQDGFVEAAQNLKSSLADDDPAWNSVLIMGQQIAPAHELFSGAVVSGGAGDLDLSFDETRAIEQQDIDEALSPSTSESGQFDEVFNASDDGGTVEQLADMSGIDFEFDEEVAAESAATDETAEAPISFDDDGLDFALDGLDDAPAETSGGGTIEQPVELDDFEDIDNTAERQGLDLDSMDVLDEGTEQLTETSGDVTAEIGADLLDATGVTSVLPDDFKVDLPSADGISDDAETLLASTSGTPLEELADLASEDETNIMPLATEDSDMDLDVADLTSELRVDDLTASTQEHAIGSGDATLFSDEVFAGDADSAADTGLNLALEDTGETNIAEVGTKLDLARAYVDMGDPEGARSILKEVLTEGDEAQQEEARKLLESLGE